MEPTKEAYREYLKSEKWKELADEAKERDGHRCVVCNSKKGLEVHHRQYPAIWGIEPLSYLTTLCAACHGLFHNVKSITVKKRNKNSKKKRYSQKRKVKQKAKVYVLRKGQNRVAQ